MSNDRKNDIEWERIFAKHKILEKVTEEKPYLITATEINEFREARLMTKFDHRSQLPKLFANNNLSLLPITRGTYLLGNFQTFHDFNKEEVPTSRIEFPSYLESLTFKDVTSEATAINCAVISNILQDFLEEKELFSTVSGRMASSVFEFNINSGGHSQLIKVNNSQIEIDGGYEGHNSLAIIEAKNYISDNFLIRQLYYPFRLWSNKIKKNVRPVFLTYTNGVFHLREFVFTDPNNYNSLVLVKQKKYLLSEGPINLETIENALNKVKIIKEPELQFPQANSFERVINLCELLKEKISLTKEEVTTNYDFDERQTNYYTDAARYLGLVEKLKNDDGQITYKLTSKGNKLFNYSLLDRQIEFAKVILSFRVFNETLRLFLDNSETPTKDQIVGIMKEANLFNVEADSTYYRRSSTVLRWIHWILNLIEE